MRRKPLHCGVIGMKVGDLANLMGVSESDLIGFAKLIASEIEKDNISDFFVSEESSGHREDITLAYASHAVKRFREFQTTYMTNSNVSNLFNDIVFAKIKYGEEIER